MLCATTSSEGLPDHGDQLLRAVLDALPELVFVLDRDGKYVAVVGGRDARRYHDGSALVGSYMHDVLPEHLADGFLERIHEALDHDRVVDYEYQLSRNDVGGVGERAGLSDDLWFEGRVAPLPGEEGRIDLVVWMAFNVTESHLALQRLHEQQEELERLASTDGLTGLLNRRRFFEESNRELAWVRRSGQPAALLTLDLDLFKQINDTHGHAAGDAVLRSVGRLLARELRAVDVLGRIGGEEFALVSRGTNLQQGLALAERLRRELSAMRVEHADQVLSCTASIGVTELWATDERPEDALRRADAALYRAKDRGRDRVDAGPPVTS